MSDLISRSELKKAIQKLEEEPNYQHEGETWQNGLYMAETLIDNAPTVHLPDFKEGYKQAIIDGKTNFSRPQGEWINEYWEDAYQKYYHTCDVCKTEIVKTAYDNYCSCCGAKMRKGGAENGKV